MKNYIKFHISNNNIKNNFNINRNDNNLIKNRNKNKMFNNNNFKKNKTLKSFSIKKNFLNNNNNNNNNNINCNNNNYININCNHSNHINNKTNNYSNRFIENKKNNNKNNEEIINKKIPKINKLNYTVKKPSYSFKINKEQTINSPQIEVFPIKKELMNSFFKSIPKKDASIEEFTINESILNSIKEDEKLYINEFNDTHLIGNEFKENNPSVKIKI